MRNGHNERPYAWLPGLLLVSAALLLSVFVGNTAFPAGALLRVLGGGAGTDPTALLILTQVRFPRALCALICGGALSLSGWLLQTALRNTLASPGVLGVNAGAGFFVLLAGCFLPAAALTRQLASLTGGLLAVLLLGVISRAAGAAKSTLILSGVAISSLFTAGSNLILTLKPDAATDRLSFTLGGLSLATWRQLAVAVPVMLAGCILTLLLARGMDLFALGDETAHGLGLEVQRTRVLAICAATALASAAVGICGLISFVGLIVPNLLRIAGIRETRHAFAACFLYGGSFLLLCDVLARTIAWPYELPVGLLLSMLGAPFFLWLLIRRGKRLGV